MITTKNFIYEGGGEGYLQNVENPARLVYLYVVLSHPREFWLMQQTEESLQTES